MPSGLAPSETRRGTRLSRLRSPVAIAFVALLAGAVAVRVYALASYWPAFLGPTAHDAAAYVRSAHVSLSLNNQDPLGYPLFLRLVHGLSHELGFTIAVQHLLGLAAGGLVFLAVRRVGGPAWLGLVPAAVVWFNGDELFLEHALLSEALFTALLAATLYAAVRSVDRAGFGWPLLAGALAASLLTVRSVGLPLTGIVVVWVALASWRAGLPWLRQAAPAAAGALVITLAYAALWHHEMGRWSVVVAGTGRSIYARAAVFADCRKFTPPRGTAFLCERTPSGKRPGPLYYGYDGGPAVAHFGGPPRGDPVLAKFGRAAILGEPFDYLHLAWTDARRYVDSEAEPVRPFDYPGSDAVAFPAGKAPVDPESEHEMLAYYSRFRLPHGTPAHGLYRYQRVFRVSGVLLLALVLLGLTGLVAAIGRLRWAIVLLMAVGLVLVLLPPFSPYSHAEWRFTVPAEVPLSAAAALAGWALVTRLAASERLRVTMRPRSA